MQMKALIIARFWSSPCRCSGLKYLSLCARMIGHLWARSGVISVIRRVICVPVHWVFPSAGRLMLARRPFSAVQPLQAGRQAAGWCVCVADSINECTAVRITILEPRTLSASELLQLDSSRSQGGPPASPRWTGATSRYLMPREIQFFFSFSLFSGSTRLSSRQSLCSMRSDTIQR